MYPRKKKVETYKKKDNFFKSLPDKQKVYPLTFINEELKNWIGKYVRNKEQQCVEEQYSYLTDPASVAGTFLQKHWVIFFENIFKTASLPNRNSSLVFQYY